MKTTILKTLLFCITTTLAYGQQWELVQIPNNIEAVNGIHFIDENTGWLAGSTSPGLNGGVVVHTQDGGETWTEQTIEADVLYDIYFVDSQKGYAVGESWTGGSYIYSTTDGGQNWSAQHHWGVVIDLDFLDENLGFISGHHGYGGGGKAFKTINGGTNWMELDVEIDESEIEFPWFETVQVIDHDIVYMLDNDGYLIKSSDQGENWHGLYIGESFGFRGMNFYSEANGVAIGNREVFYTEDAGLTWDELSMDVSQFVIEGTPLYRFEDVNFVNSQYGFIVGEAIGRNLIYKTSDGGNSWDLDFYDEVFGILNKVFFLNSNTGWAVGESTETEEKHILKYIGNLSINDPGLSQAIQVYPNPVQDQIAINNTSNSDITQVEIYNLLGAKVDEITINSQEAVIDVRKLKAGTYFLKIYADSGVVTKKIIKR